MAVTRQTVDLAGYPDLVVIFLGMRANSLKGLRTVIQTGPRIQKAVAEQPEGLLRHEFFMLGLLPVHVGMRQYWRDFDALERWARSLPHQGWWKSFLRDPGGTGFWHETYCAGGGIEAVYDDMRQPTGMMNFAPLTPARGAMFSARRRAGLAGEETAPEALSEADLYVASAR